MKKRKSYQNQLVKDILLLIAIAIILPFLLSPLFTKYNWILVLYTSLCIPFTITIVTHYLQRSEIIQKSSVEIHIILKKHFYHSFVYWSLPNIITSKKHWLKIENTGASMITSIYLIFNRTEKQKDTVYEIYYPINPNKHILFAIPDSILEKGIQNITIIYYANAIDCSSQFCGNLQKYRDHYYFSEMKEADKIKWKKAEIITCQRNTYCPLKISARISEKSLE